MRALITGAAGFIGRAVCRQLTGRGVEVVPYDRALDPADDICAVDRVRRALTGCDVVVHLAAKVGLGVDLADLDDYVRTNDLGTAVVLRAVTEAGVRRVVLASSMVVYGEGAYACPLHGTVRPGARRRADLAGGRFEPPCPSCGRFLSPLLVDEDAPLDPRNVYAATKVHGEHLAAAWARESGGQAAALRFHNVYGPGLPRNTPYAGVAALFVTRLARNEAPLVYEDGGQRRDFVHVDDVAAAAAAATEVPLSDGLTALNIGSGRVTTVGEMAAMLSTSVAGPAPEVTGAYRLGDVRHITADSGRARRLLGWQPQIELVQGLRDLVHGRDADVAGRAADR